MPPADAIATRFLSAFSAADLRRYLNDPFRAPLLVARELTVVDLPGMSEDFFALRALTAADHERYARFFHGMRQRGIALAPSGYEAWFVSAAHTDEDVERTVLSAGEVARELAG